MVIVNSILYGAILVSKLCGMEILFGYRYFIWAVYIPHRLKGVVYIPSKDKKQEL